LHALAKDQQYQEKSLTVTAYQGREGWIILQLQQAHGANNNNNHEFRQPPWFRLAKIFIISRGRCDKSSRAEFQNSICDIDLFFQQKGFQSSLVEQLTSDPNLLPYF